jgi:hypothetical protein
MNAIPKPIPQQGNRNTFCPHYGACLDFAIGCSWKVWNCSRCPLKAKQLSVNEYVDVSADPEPCYELPPELVQRFGGNLLDWE